MKSKDFKQRLKEAIFGVPPISEEGKQFLEADPENGSRLVDAVINSRGKDKVKVQLKDGATIELTVA